jgi:hypothetical protein
MNPLCSRKRLSASISYTQQRQLVHADAQEPLCVLMPHLFYAQAFNFRLLKSNADVLSTLGFDFLSLANNHILDYYEQGLRDTMQAGCCFVVMSCASPVPVIPYVHRIYL